MQSDTPRTKQSSFGRIFILCSFQLPSFCIVCDTVTVLPEDSISSDSDLLEVDILQISYLVAVTWKISVESILKWASFHLNFVLIW